ncbi:hypothetical protein BaRGS_00037474 [Batillaria attramentaria]|uniref:Uncharacterized protein n=1 Tax=Batillaria attramentaria TaxID=370345 RepID=A0ABD0J905_9CAEN
MEAGIRDRVKFEKWHMASAEHLTSRCKKEAAARRRYCNRMQKQQHQDVPVENCGLRGIVTNALELVEAISDMNL